MDRWDDWEVGTSLDSWYSVTAKQQTQSMKNSRSDSAGSVVQSDGVHLIKPSHRFRPPLNRQSYPVHRLLWWDFFVVLLGRYSYKHPLSLAIAIIPNRLTVSRKYP